MKILTAVGWLLLVIDALFVLMLFITKNAGDDAAGRGMATGFAIVLAPIVVVAGALLFWGSRGGPRAAFYAGLGIVALPLIFLAARTGGNLYDRVDQRFGQSRAGSFDDKQLTTMSRAMEKKDIAALRQALARATPDWSARDHRERTILGNAIEFAADDYETTDYLPVVSMLLDAGAPVRDDALMPAAPGASGPVAGVVTRLYNMPHASAHRTLELLLTRGLSPNAVDTDGRPIHFSTETRVSKLEILARHGASFSALDTRPDRAGWNALMFAVQVGLWPEAEYFLTHGQSPDFVAPDGTSARSILREAEDAGTTYHGSDAEARARFMRALAAFPEKQEMQGKR